MAQSGEETWTVEESNWGSQRSKTIGLAEWAQGRTMFTLAFFYRHPNILKFAHSWLSMLITIHWPTYRDFILGRGFWLKEDRWNKSFLALVLGKIEVIQPSLKKAGTSRVSSLVRSWWETLRDNISCMFEWLFKVMKAAGEAKVFATWAVQSIAIKHFKSLWYRSVIKYNFKSVLHWNSKIFHVWHKFKELLLQNKPAFPN